MKVTAWFRRLILSLFQPFAKRIGHVYIAFSRPQMSLGDVDEVIKRIQVGDVLNCRSRGEFTNWFIPGFWTHSAMYIGAGEIVEAVSPHVKIRRLSDFLLEKDWVCVLRPKFADTVQKNTAVTYARLQASNRIPYDYHFTPNEDAFYCAELIGGSYVFALEGKSPFVPKYSLGVLTYVPNDFYNAVDKFDVVWIKDTPKVPTRTEGKTK